MIEQVDELLTLKGLRMLFLKNRPKQEEEGLRP